MLKHSQKLSDGLIVFSVLVSDFEKLDFKNDALAGVRANYFNSKNSAQREKTEIEIDGRVYNLSYCMQSGSPLSWKMTKNNLPYQSVKRATGGVYCVMFYTENGIIYKRQYFDCNHNWLRTEYYDKAFANKLVCRIYPSWEHKIVVLKIEKTAYDGTVSKSSLYPSEKQTKDNPVLIYTNIGMVWYSADFKPEDIDLTDSFVQSEGGFNFSPEHFDSSYAPQSLLDLKSADYLEQVTEQSDDEQIKEQPEPTYSAYDKIERILTEAHKTNKDIFGEIMLHTSDDEDTESNEEVLSDETTESNEKPETVNMDSLQEQTVNDDFTASKDIEAEQIEKTAMDSDNSEDVSKVAEEKIYDEELQFHNDSIVSEEEAVDNLQEYPATSSDGEPEYDEPEYEIGEESHCDAVIITKSGRYTYYGDLDSTNCRVGRGRTVTPDGLTSYDGEYADDMRSGFGVCYYKDGSINYVGNWAQNSRHGSGVGYRQSDGTMHAGKWNNNSPDGYGARFDQNGEFIDVSLYSNGVKNGKSLSFNEFGQVVIAEYENGNKVSERIIDED